MGQPGGPVVRGLSLQGGGRAAAPHFLSHGQAHLERGVPPPWLRRFGDPAWRWSLGCSASRRGPTAWWEALAVMLPDARWWKEREAPPPDDLGTGPASTLCSL